MIVSAIMIPVQPVLLSDIDKITVSGNSVEPEIIPIIDEQQIFIGTITKEILSFVQSYCPKMDIEFKNYLNKNVPTVSADADSKELLELLNDKTCSAVVLDRQKHVRGIIGPVDLLNHLCRPE